MKFIANLFVVLFVSVLNSVSGMESSQTGSQLSADGLMILTPGIFYQPTVIDFSPNEDCIKTTQEKFKKAQDQCSRETKKTDRLKAGLCLYRDLASQGHVPSILSLGDICQRFNNYFGALKWYVYGFQVHWLTTGEHNATAMNCIKKLKNNKEAKKCRDLAWFNDKNTTLFLEIHPVGKHKESKSLQELEFHYEESTNCEDYLPEAERQTKAVWFGDFYFEHYATPDEQYTEGQKRWKMNQGLRALRNLQRSQLPDALYDAGCLYALGKVGRIDGRIDYETAANFYIKANTPKAHYSFGWLLHFGQYGLINNGQPNYQEAAKHYRLGGNDPEALCNLGHLYGDGYLSEDGKPNYIEAARHYLSSKHRIAWYTLGKLIRDGHVRIQNNEVQPLGEETPEELQGAYEQAACCFEKAQCPESKNDLAILYVKGLIRLKDGKPDIATGFRLYDEANIPIATLNLAYNYFSGLHNAKAQPDYIRSYVYLMKTEKQIEVGKERDENIRYIFPKTIQKRFQVVKFFYPEISGLIKNSSQEKLLKDLHETISKMIPSLKHSGEPSDLEFMLGLLAFSRDGDNEKALFHFNKALTFGHRDADIYIEYIQKLINLEAADAQKQEELKLQELEKEKVPQAEPSFANVPILKEKQETEPVVAVIPEAEKPKRDKPERKVLSYQEKVEKALEKLKKKIRTKSESFQSIQKVEPLSPLNITFLDETVKEQYNALQNLKLQEVLEDIHEKPYATSGVGKPEVLLGKYKGYKGCISRRLSGEDRLVYKVIGPRKILILSCKGHYE